MFVKQISVYLENVRGTLRDMTKTIGENGIDLLALSIADTANFGIVRLVVREEQIPLTIESMRAAGFMVRMDEVISVAVPNKPQGLDHVLAVLDEADLAVEYIYSLTLSLKDAALLVIRANDNQKAADVLAKSGVTLYGQKELNQL